MKHRMIPAVLALLSFPFWYWVAPPPPGWTSSDPVVSLAAGTGTHEVTEVAAGLKELQDKQALLRSKLEVARKEMAKAEAHIFQPPVTTPGPPSLSVMPAAGAQAVGATPSDQSEEEKRQLQEKTRHRILEEWRREDTKIRPYRDEAYASAKALVAASRYQAAPFRLQRGTHWIATGETVLWVLSLQKGTTTKEKANPLLTTYQQHSDIFRQLEAVHPEVTVDEWVQWVSDPFCGARNLSSPGTELWLLSLVTRTDSLPLAMDHIGAELNAWRLMEIPPGIHDIVIPRHRNWDEDRVGLPGIAFRAIDQFLYQGNLDSAAFLYDFLGGYLRANPRAIASQYVVWALQRRHQERLAERLIRHGVAPEEVAWWTSPQTVELRFVLQNDGSPARAYRIVEPYQKMIYATFTYPNP
jgi:hypothetical protein